MGCSTKWRDLLQKSVALMLLTSMVVGIGSFYERRQIRHLICGVYCQQDELPNRILREFLNGRADREPTPETGWEVQPVENPSPENREHYYARLQWNGLMKCMQGCGDLNA